MQTKEQIRKKQHECYLKRKARKEAVKPLDPITLLCLEDKCYIAGLMDGEGCIRIGAVGTNRQYKYPIVTIAMTHRGVIEWLTEKLQTGTLKMFNYTAVKKNPRWKKQYGIFISGKRAKLLCEVLLPFLKVKKSQAELICKFPGDDLRGRGAKLLPEVLIERNRLFQQIHVLNRRGPNPQEGSVGNGSRNDDTMVRLLEEPPNGMPRL